MDLYYNCYFINIKIEIKFERKIATNNLALLGWAPCGRPELSLYCFFM